MTENRLETVIKLLYEMLPLTDDTDKFIDKEEMKNNLIVIENMMKDLRRNLHCDNSAEGKDGADAWKVPKEFYNDFYRDGKWSQLIKSLRMADNDVHRLRFTNIYVEQHINSFYDDVKEIRNTSEGFSQRLTELSRMENELNAAIFERLPKSSLSKPPTKNVKFGAGARKSKSAECSLSKARSPYGLMLKEWQLTSKDKTKRTKNYGKYCSSCGTVEVSSQSSVIKCCDCDGEIVIQGLCSSCDSFKGRLVPKKLCDRPVEKACSTCDFLRKKRICWDDKKVCNKCKKGKGSKMSKEKEVAWASQDRKMRSSLSRYVEESSCCSDCDYTSSCDAATDYKRKHLSLESLVPLSDCDNLVVDVRSYSQDYDVSSSISSSATEMRKSLPGTGTESPKPEESNQETPEAPEETVSADEEFNTPREFPTDASNASPSNSEESLRSEGSESNKSGQEGNDIPSEISCESSESQEYLEAVESYQMEDLSKESFLKDLVQEPDLSEVSGRLRRAEEALGFIAEGNVKLEEGLSAIEELSHRNLKFSTTLQEIMVAMSTHLEHLSNVSSVTEPESEGSDEFADASEDFQTKAGALIPYKSARNYSYLCFRCGINTSESPLEKCLSCDGSLTEVPKAVADKNPDKRNEITLMENLKHFDSNSFFTHLEELKRMTFPIIIKMDLLRLPLSGLQNRLKVLEREAGYLRDNNDKMDRLVDELRKKITSEMTALEKTKPQESDSVIPATAVFGFDVSFYQYKSVVTETRNNEDSIVETTKEEVCQSKRTFLEMKFEEVFKKEEQTVLELEIFEQKLEVEGLIIKEKEDYYTCSNTSQAVDNFDERAPFPVPLPRRFTSEQFEGTNERVDQSLLISIEIDVEKESEEREKDGMRCEYRTNMSQNILTDGDYSKRKEYERVIPTITLFPMWSGRRDVGIQQEIKGLLYEDIYDRREMGDNLERDHNSSDSYFLTVEDDFVEIKSPKCFYCSSDEESESCAGDYEKHKRRFHSVTAVEMTPAMHPVTEISAGEIPFAVYSTEEKTACRMKEFGRISHMELEEPPCSGVVLLQTEALSSIEEIKGKAEGVIDGKTSRRESSCLVRFIQTGMACTSVASIRLIDSSFPILISDSFVENDPPGSGGEELTEALALIKEVQEDVARVKLDNALAILPKLESILRDHLTEKMDVLKKESSTVTNSSLDVFMSSLNFVADEQELSSVHSTRDNKSEERLEKMLNLLSGLEEAVKEINAKEDKECHETDAGHICDLLKALSIKIKGIGSEPKLSEVEKTIELTSELDIAIRDYSSESSAFPSVQSSSSDGLFLAEKLKTAKTKIFEVVAVEARDREERIDRDYDRIALLEKENAEVMKFLNTLLDKTLNRVKELEEVRAAADAMERNIKDLIPALERRERKKRNSDPNKKKLVKTPTLPSIQEVSSDYRTSESSEEEGKMRETLSGMIVAVDNLKTRAKEKKRKYDEIFGGESCSSFKNLVSPEKSMSDTGKIDIQSKITQFQKIGANTFYISWSKPEIPEEECTLTGYEIWVNGKVNQRVRNPERLKAVLYFINVAAPGDVLNVKLLALTDNNRKHSLDNITYP